MEDNSARRDVEGSFELGLYNEIGEALPMQAASQKPRQAASDHRSRNVPRVNRFTKQRRTEFVEHRPSRGRNGDSHYAGLERAEGA